MGPDREWGGGSNSKGMLFPLVAIVVVVGALSIGARRAFMRDLKRQGAMTLNGEAYESRLGDPIAYVQEYEAGFSTSRRCTVLYPLQMPGALHQPGIEIEIDPESVTLGQDLTFGPESAGHGVQVSYYPRSGHDLSRGIMLGFSSLRSGGSCTIRFERLDTQEGGRIQGKLLHATLYGFRESAEGGEVSELEEPRKLELTSFPFDVAVQTQEQGLVRRPHEAPANR